MFGASSLWFRIWCRRSRVWENTHDILGAGALFFVWCGGLQAEGNVGTRMLTWTRTDVCGAWALEWDVRLCRPNQDSRIVLLPFTFVSSTNQLLFFNITASHLLWLYTYTLHEGVSSGFVCRYLQWIGGITWAFLTSKHLHFGKDLKLRFYIRHEGINL